MSEYEVSARKYRPQSFASVMGQDSLGETLKNSIKSQRLSHAYLFCGPRGVGKTTCARIFAKTINCEHPTVDGEACNECESCRTFNEHKSMNVFELDAASNNGVEDMRTLISQVRIAPAMGKYCVYIIDEVHMLSTQAFNTLLKTLEEPPSYVVFILATTEKAKVLPTIISRCQVFDFKRISVPDIVTNLMNIAQKENIAYESEALNVIAEKADGGMRDALSIFDQIASASQQNITYQATIQNLNVLDYNYYFKILPLLLKGDVKTPLLVLDEILSKGFDAQYFIAGLAQHIRNVMVSKDVDTVKLLNVSQELADLYVEQGLKIDNKWIFSALSIANQCDLEYQQSRNKRLLVELAIIRIAQLSAADVQSAKTRPALRLIAPLHNDLTLTLNPVEIKLPDGTYVPSEKRGQGVVSPEQKLAALAPMSEPYSEPDIVAAWENYAELFNNSQIAFAMKETQPRRKEGDVWIVGLPNKATINAFNELKAVILYELRVKLKNTNIQLEYILERQSVKERETPEQIFNNWSTQYPELINIAKDLKLTFA